VTHEQIRNGEYKLSKKELEKEAKRRADFCKEYVWDPKKAKSPEELEKMKYDYRVLLAEDSRRDWGFDGPSKSFKEARKISPAERARLKKMGEKVAAKRAKNAKA